MPICIEIPIVMAYEKCHVFFGDFRICRPLATFPYTLHTPQHQIVHFQHKKKSAASQMHPTPISRVTKFFQSHPGSRLSKG